MPVETPEFVTVSQNFQTEKLMRTFTLHYLHFEMHSPALVAEHVTASERSLIGGNGVGGADGAHVRRRFVRGGALVVTAVHGRFHLARN